MYLGAINHSHFSGTVPVEYILQSISDGLEDKVKMIKQSNQLLLEYTNHVENGEEYDEVVVMEYVEDCWDKGDSNAIGALFYGLIKHKNYYPIYMNLMFNLLDDENVDHIDLRLKLGSIHPVKGDPIKFELNILNSILRKWKKKGKSFSIIPQASKHSKPHKVESYFLTIIKHLNTMKLDPYIISGFDITGCEDKGNKLHTYEKIIRRLQDKSSIPWYFHADETGISSNLDFANKYGDIRVGHGTSGNTHLVRELCPYTYMYLHNRSDEEIREMLLKGNFTISPDDTNKFRDMTMRDNIDYVLSLGIDVKDAIKNSIMVTRLPMYRKTEMLNKIA